MHIFKRDGSLLFLKAGEGDEDWGAHGEEGDEGEGFLHVGDGAGEVVCVGNGGVDVHEGEDDDAQGHGGVEKNGHGPEQGRGGDGAVGRVGGQRDAFFKDEVGRGEGEDGAEPADVIMKGDAKPWAAFVPEPVAADGGLVGIHGDIPGDHDGGGGEDEGEELPEGGAI